MFRMIGLFVKMLVTVVLLLALTADKGMASRPTTATSALSDGKVTADRPTLPLADLKGLLIQLQIHILARFKEVATRLDDIVELLGRPKNANQSCAAAAMDDRCPMGYTHLPGTESCYEIISIKATWLEALMRCEMQYGAHMLEVNTLEEFRAIEEFLNYSRQEETNWGYYWTSGREVAGEGTWRWVTSSTPITLKSLWGKGQPNNPNNVQHCLAVAHKAGGGSPPNLNDIDCGVVSKYICEIRRKPL